MVDRRQPSGQYRGDERTDQAYMGGTSPRLRLGSGEATDLRAGEAFEGVAAGQFRSRRRPAELHPDFLALPCGG